MNLIRIKLRLLLLHTSVEVRLDYRVLYVCLDLAGWEGNGSWAKGWTTPQTMTSPNITNNHYMY